MRLRNNKVYKQLMKGCLAACLILFCSHSLLNAQSSTQINIIGIPPSLTTPFADDIENSFRTGQYQIIFNYTSFTSLPVDFVFDFVLYRNNRAIVDITSAPRAFTPGSYVFTSFFEENQFRETPNDIIASLDSQLRNQVVQSGAMPEGNYSIEITARPFSQQSGITAIPGRTNFSVRYPPPPILVSVPDGANLLFETPVFSWTPVVSSTGGTFEYEFLLVELFEGQTPLQAINSNRAHASETLVGRTTLPYTLEYLPLEAGMEYAWQVRASDVMGNAPLQNDGESEIYTFRFRDKGDLEDLMASFESISLVPNFVELIDLDRVDIEETPMSYILNGQVSAEINVPGSADQVVVSAFANNLEIQRSGGEVAVIMGGSVDLNASGFESIYPDYNQIIRFESVSWDAVSGLTANVAVNTPDDKTISADGDLLLTQTDIAGVVTAKGSPLFAYGNELVNLELTSISATFPGGNITANGDFKVYGIETPCAVNNLNFENDQLASTVSCRNLSSEFSIGDDSIIEIVPSQLVGNFLIDRAEDSFNYNVSLQSSLAINLSDDRTCDVNFLTVMDSESGVEYSPLSQNCNVLDGGIDLGFAKLAMRDVELHSIDFNIEEQDWDFDIEFDTRLTIEQFGGWQSPWFENTRISKNGVTFENQTFVRNSPTLPDFDLMGYTMKLQELVINEFTFPLFDWDQEGPGPWDIEFSGDFKTPELKSMPKCFTGTWGTIENGRITSDRVITDINLQIPDGCNWEFGLGYSIEMNGVTGRIGLDWDTIGGIDDIRPFAELLVDGNVTGGYPHRCNEQSEEYVVVSIDNGINAELEGLFTDCPVTIGPFEANLINSTINLSWHQQRGQQGELAADVEISLNQDIEEEESDLRKLKPTGLKEKLNQEAKAGGSVVFDIINGRIIDASIFVEGPFKFELPKGDAVFTFILNSAEITREGLLIDGRHELLFGEDSMGATFDNFLIDYETFQVVSGRVIFDEAIAFEAGIDGNSLSFNAVPIDYETKLDPGLYMELGGTVVIDSTGIATSGEANAVVNYGDKKIGSDLSVQFTSDFRMGLFPFSVQQGEANFLYEESVFATVDRDGFHPDPMFFAEMIIPERLPLPDEDIAYIQLREFDELLIDYEELDDGLFSITTKEGQPLSLVLPVLDEQNPPTVAQVNIIDLVISGDPRNPRVVSGSVIADIDPNHEMAALSDYGYPIQVNRLIFGDANPDGLGANAGLYLEGKLNLFDSVFSEMPDIGLYIQDSGIVEAEIFVDGFEDELELVPGSDLVVYQLNSFYGTLNGNLRTLQAPTFQFELFGNFQVTHEDEAVASAILDLKVTQNTFNIEYFDAQIEDLPALSLGDFELDFKKIKSLPEFSFTPETGFNFAAALDLDIVFNLSNGETFRFPLSGFEIGTNGFSIPQQNVHSGAPAGLTLPSFNIFDFEFQPIALRTPEPIQIDWNQPGWNFNPDFELDFELRLPEFEDSGMFPPDGLTFNNVGFSDGLLTGSVEAYFPLGGAEIPLGPQSINPPILLVNSIGGSFGIEVEDGEQSQNVDIFVDANLTNLPSFSQPDQDECGNNPDLTLSIVEGRGFQGSFTGYVPCGEIEVGPIAFEAIQSDLYLDFVNGLQQVWLDGEIQATLPAADDATTTVSGSALLNVITGNIMGGEIAINSDFELGLGPDLNNPIFNLALQQAVIDSSGLTLTGTGDVVIEDFSASLTLNDLKLNIASMSVIGGSAVIESGLAFDVNLSPVEFTGVVPGSPITGDNMLRFSVDSAVELSASGLAFTGSGSAELIHSGENFSSLGLNFEDDFTVNFNSFPPNVVSGRAEFLLEGSEEPIVIWDTNGFSLGGGLVAMLPDRIGLPIESIAYVDLVNEEGEPIIQVESNDEGGYTLSTGDESLPIFIPALSEEGEEVETLLAAFTLSTDGQYNVISGSIQLEENFDLESKVSLPVTLTGLDIGQTDSGVRLQADLMARLPSIFSGSEATGTFIFEQGVGLSGAVTVGNYIDDWSIDTEEIEPLFVFEVADDEEDSPFSAELYGIEIEFGAAPALRIASAFTSSILTNENIEDDESLHSLYMNIVYNDGNWEGGANLTFASDGVDLGLAKFIPDAHNAFSLELGEDRFVVAFNGVISFDELLDDDFSIAIQALQLGVEDIQSSPSLVFGLGEAAAGLPDQEFDLLSGTLTGQFTSPQIGISGSTLSLSSSEGNLSFLDQSLSYSDFFISTDGDFSIGNIGTDAFELFGDYVDLEGLAVAFEESELTIGANFMIQLPEPVAQSAGASILVKRGEGGTIEIESEGPNFDFEGVYSIAELAEFHLYDAAININISDPLESSFLANGAVMFEIQNEYQEVITFGNPGNALNEAGISFQASRRNNPLRFNATGNVDFSFEHSFFSIDISANGVANSTQSEFLLVMNGYAGMTLAGVSGGIGYEGFTLSASGVEDIGNFTGEGELTLMGFASLGLGQFYYSDEEMTITLNSPPDDQTDPDQLGDSASTESVTVTRLLCFGAFDGIDQCGGSADALTLSLGGDTNSSGGGISGGIEGILFYETDTGDRLFYLNGFSVEVSDVFSMYATVQYESTAPQAGGDLSGSEAGMMLRVAASAQISLGDEAGVGAIVAGKFENRGGLSFGLFVAVTADGGGIPIVPGVLELTGVGGGFFYRPNSDDLTFVHDIIDRETDHELQGNPGGGGSQGGEIKFAAMLYAQANIAGSGGISVIRGSTFFEVTNQSFYFDVFGTVMGMGGADAGSPANLELTAGGYLSMTFQKQNGEITDFLLEGSISFNAFIPVIIDGSGELVFFAGKTQATGFLWGIDGEAHLSVYGGILSGYADFLASDIGFLFEGGLSVTLDIPIISFDADLVASIWYIDHSDFSIPFGGYATAAIEICVVICGNAQAVGAFARQGNQLNLYAYGEVGKLSGYVSVKTPGPSIDYGSGKGDGVDLIAQAMEQKERFEEYIENLRDELAAALQDLDQIGEPEIPTVSEEDVRLAGYRLFTAGNNFRNEWGAIIRANENAGSSIPATLNNLIVEIIEDLPHSNTVHYSPNNYNIYRLLSNYYQDELDRLFDDIFDLLTAALEDAAEIEEMAEIAYDEFLSVMAQNPVSNVQRVNPENYGSQAPSFQVDEDLAASQYDQVEDAEQLLNQLGIALLEPIKNVEEMLSSIDDLMYDQPGSPIVFGDIVIDSSPSILGFAALYNRAITMAERGYAIDANVRWMLRNWSIAKRAYIQNNSTSIDNSINTISNQVNATNFIASRLARVRTADRVNIIETLLKGNYPRPSNYDRFTPDSGSGEAETVYNSLNSNTASVRLTTATTNNERFWYDMFNLGLSEIVATTRESIENILEDKDDTVSLLMSSHRTFTSSIEDFYDMKANTYAILYGMVDNFVSTMSISESMLSAELQDELANYTGELQTLAQKLQPPVISSVNITPDQPGNNFMNFASIDWVADHPFGVEESSIQIEGGHGTVGDYGVYHGLGEYRSVGQETTYSLNITRETGFAGTVAAMTNSNINTQSFNIGVRVRGAAGTTATRRAQFDLSVGPNGQTIQSGQNAIPNAVEKPKRAVMRLSRNYIKSGGIAWTNDPQVIRIAASARDEVLGIERFEYRVLAEGTFGNLIDWTILPSGNFEYINSSTALVNSDSQVINMEPDRLYRVQVRAVNSAELVGLPSILNLGAVKYDPNPPSDIQKDESISQYNLVRNDYNDGAGQLPLLFYTSSVQTYDPVFSSPELESFLTPQNLSDILSTNRVPTIAAAWTESTSDLSGLAHYQYVVTTSESVDENDFEDRGQTTQNTSVVLKGGSGEPFGDLITNYEDPVYLHVRAMNNAGSYSNMLTYELIPPDMLSPSAPIMRVRPTANNVRLTLTYPSADGESGLKGIQYSIGTSPGSTNIRPYPSTDEVDLQLSNEHAASVLQFMQTAHLATYTNTDFLFPSLNINRGSLPKNQALYFNFRSVNNQGGKSTVRATGPIVITDNPPSKPTLSANWGTGGLILTVSNIKDHTVGVTQVQYRVLNRTTGNVIRGWRTFHNYNDPMFSTDSRSKNITLSSNRNHTNTNIEVRVRNVYNKTRTAKLYSFMYVYESAGQFQMIQ